MTEPKITSQELSREDHFYLDLALKNKALIAPPRHSNFRTYTIITYQDLEDKIQYVTGTNRETFFLGGTICGERSACLKLAEVEVKEVKTVYLVSDSSKYISMGIACRDFLIDQLPVETRVVMWGQNNYKVTTLAELYPYPAIYRNINVTDVVGFAQNFAQSMEKPIFDSKLAELYRKAIDFTKYDDKDVFYPIRLAAGVLYENGEMEIAWQTKMLEFAKTVDPVTNLLPGMRKNRLLNINPVVIIQVDQFGVLQTLSDGARCNLAEDGFGSVKVFIHSKNGKITELKVADLYPDTPKVSEML